MLLIFLIVGSQVLSSQLNPLTEQQMRAVTGLQQCSQQAEDALSQGLEKLQQTLSETLACDLLGTFSVTNYMGQMAIAMTKLEALASFVNQVIHKFCRHNQFILDIFSPVLLLPLFLVADMRTGRYRAVLRKIDCQRSISAVDGRMREKLTCPHAVTARRSRALFLPRAERKVEATQITFGRRPCSKCTASSQFANQHEGCLPWVTTSNAFAPLAPYGRLVLPHEPA
ncbi:hypothetical protein BHE74_00032320 [Ensete ventricosum]|nr:hypothetical protein BHE74_00032320 [Ensete ventricosum]